ncbi:hypothetical protein ACIQ4I_15355 [Rummeliibacillus sp. NPDC094406]|uniref:hypothetical protein n=1 Tax=Rummeliibacillus sp. NPDC094406 TaxID=3364511 RepID=UPI003828D858
MLINQYVLSKCQYIINSFNEQYGELKKSNNEMLKVIADNEYSEMDFQVRLFPYFEGAKYNVEDEKGKVNDVYYPTLDYRAEVKLLRNYRCSSKNRTSSNSSSWKELRDDLHWLKREIANNKGKRVLIIGWFNVVERFSQVVQLGKGKGCKPDIDYRKLGYFPFLRSTGDKTFAIEYKYLEGEKPQSVDSLYSPISNVDCIFLGNKEDVFHIAIYY